MIWKHAHAKWMHKLHCLCPSEPVTCLSMKNIHILLCSKKKENYYLYNISVTTKLRHSLPVAALLPMLPATTRLHKLVNHF